MTILRHDNNDTRHSVLGRTNTQDSIPDAGLVALGNWDSGDSKNLGEGDDINHSSGLVGAELSSSETTWPISSSVTELKSSRPCEGRILKAEGQFLPGRLSNLLVLLAVLCTSSTGVYASPIHGNNGDSKNNKSHRFYPRAVSQSTWIPIVAVCGFAFVLGTLTCWRRRKTIAGLLRNRVIIANSSTGTRELTADQLAGSINNDQNSNTRARRSRRPPRRTPSQLSTHSLPAYAKEPGEQELVVLQGPTDMEDAPIPQPLATVVDLGDDAETSTESPHEIQYTPVPDSSANSPLLEDERTDDQSSSDHHAGSHRPSGSIGAGSDSADTSSLARVDSADPASIVDPRGEAPPYFEVVEQPGAEGGVRRGFIDAGPHNTPASPILDAAPSPPSSPQPTSPRRSGFRSLLNRMSVSGTSHARNNSSASVMSSSASHSHSHIRGPSGASILSPFRPLSRQRSIASHNSSRPNLTSPSLISLNSISAPLTHTVVRTEFAYPRTGPTEDQMRLIASRESLARFGVPYGADAVAFASLSRDNLTIGERPPEFEAAVSGEGDSSGGGASARSAAGVSERRSGEGSQVQEAPTNEANLNTAAGSSTSTPLDGLPVERAADMAVVAGIPVTHSALDVNGVAESDEKADEDQKDDDEGQEMKDKGKSKEVMTEEKQSLPTHELEQEVQTFVFVDPTGLNETSSPPKATPEVPASNPLAEGPASVQVVPPRPISRPVTPSTSSSEESTTSTPPSDISPPPTKASAAPPSSYHPPPQTHLRSPDEPQQRSESRASQLSYASQTSYASDVTFRTAAESLSSRKGPRWPNVSDDEDDGDGDAGSYHNGHDSDEADTVEGADERPSTPTLGGKTITRHGRESTDATITGPTLSMSSRTSRMKQEKHMSSATITHA